AAGDVTHDDVAVGQRRDHQLLDVPAELGAEERGHHVGVGAGDHLHHDEAGRDVVDVAVTAHGADAVADEPAEDDEIQRGGDHRRHQGLDPDAQHPLHLAHHDGVEADEVVAQATHGLPSLRSVSLMNSSSRRLALLRMESTCTPARVSSSNSMFTSWSLFTSTSRVVSSVSTTW